MKKLAILTMTMLAVTLVSCCSTNCGKRSCKEAFTLISPAQDATLTQHTQAQDDFRQLLEKEHTHNDQNVWLEKRRETLGENDLSLPKRNTFSWKCNAEGVAAHAVEVSECPRFTGNVMHFAVQKGKSEAQVHSLKANRKYYWRVVGTDSGARPVTSAVASFRTADEIPRWIFLDGGSNVRDMGGWTTKDGRRVRQGLIFRGGEMRCHMIVTPEGLQFVEYELGLRSLLDLRGAGELEKDSTHGSALSPRVRWFNTPIGGYAPCGTDGQKKLYAKAFRIIIEPTNLPLYTHCWGGADRTATLIFLLNAALGVNDKDLLTDYELTSLSIWGSRSRETDQFKGFDAYLETLAPGQDYQAKAVAYWKSAGITEKEIETLRNMFLEDTGK